MGLARRSFLKLSAAGAVVAGLGAAWFAGDGRNGRAFIRAILDKRLGHTLNLDPDGVDRFIETYEAEISARGGLKFKILAGLYPAYIHTPVLELPPTRDALWWQERDIVDNFLMGSGFFLDVAAYEAGEPLVFVERYDPIAQPCTHPFGMTS